MFQLNTFLERYLNFRSKNRKGFTLLEMLLTTSIIGVLSVVTLSSWNPAMMLGRARDGRRAVDIRELLGAITAFTIQNDGTIPPNQGLPSIPGPAGFSGGYVVEGSINSPRATRVVDLDGDGDNDIVATASKGNSKDVGWWENTSGTSPHFTWTEHNIDNSNFKGWDVTAGDIDGDTAIDIIAVDNQSRDVAWWQNLGGSPPSFGSRVEVHGNFRGVRSVDIADIDGDTDMDIMAGGNSIFEESAKWYRNDGTPTNDDWGTRDINWLSFLYNIDEIYAVDLDEDGDIDALGGGYYLRPYWWENDGTPWQDGWTQYRIDSSWANLRGIAYGDIDNDNDIDVVGISTSKSVSWWENDGNPHQNDWIEHSVANNMGGDDVVVGDIDNDGDLDVVGSSEGGDKVAYWENVGGGSFSGTYVFATGNDVNGVADLELVDLDKDGDLDVVLANSVADTVTWWMNTSIASASEPAPVAGVAGEYKPICREGTSDVECDAEGGVTLDVLVPTYIAAIPNDPMHDDESVMTGYEVRFDEGTFKLFLRAPLAEHEEEIEILGPVGVENCLIWDIVQNESTCVLFE